MSGEEETEDKFVFDQPWNPVSYFEEENEATGGNPSGSAYSPSKLASLFEVNKLAVDQDIAMRKRLNSLPDESLTTNHHGNADIDIDNLSQYTLEVDNGINILDTTPAINKKAIFNDLDRLRRWRETVDKPSKEVYIHEEDDSNYLYDISDNTPNESNANNLIDLNMDYILKSLPDVTNLDNDMTNVNCYGKLQELENQINVNDNLFSIGTTNTEIINTSIIQQKKNNITGEVPELIIDKFIVGDVLNDEYTINNISDLNRKNSEIDSSIQTIESTKIEKFNNVDNEYLNNNNIDCPKEIDVSDDLDNLFDDTDDDNDEDDLELPDVPEHLVDVSSENEGLKFTDTDDQTNLDNKLSNTDSVVQNDLDIQYNDQPVVTDTTGENVCTTLINSCGNPSITDVDVIDNTHSNMYDFVVDDIISSNETDAVDALIDYAEDVTGRNFDSPKEKDILKNDICNNEGQKNEEHNQSMISSNLDNESLAIECILDHIENTEINKTEPIIKPHCPSILEVKSELGEKNNVPQDSDNITVETNLNVDEAFTSTDIFESNLGNQLDLGAGSTTLIASVFNSKNNSFSSDGPSEVLERDNTNIDSLDSSLVQPNNSHNHPISIPKTVDVSAVHYEDSIGCLTPDDEEDTMMASTSGYNANRIYDSDNEPSTSSAGIEKEYNNDSDDINIVLSGDVDVDVKNIETEVCSSLDLDQENTDNNVSETVSISDINTDSLITNIPEDDNLTNVDCQNLDESSGGMLVHELIAASDHEIQPIRTSIIDDTADINSNTEQLETPPLVKQGSAIVENSELHEDTTETNDDIFDDPSVPSDNNVMLAAQDASNLSEPSERACVPRSSGSVRRVRFSLDNEDPQEDNETASQLSGSFTDPIANAAASSSQGIENPPNAAVTTEVRTLGWIAPKWIPDSDARSCMNCNVKFTVVKRRHHCRACGKVLCSQCCNMKFHLPYMDYKPVRVCQTCCDIMINVLNGAAQSDQPPPPTPQQPPLQPPTPPNFPLPEAPPPYSETVDGLTERHGSTSSSAPPYSEAALPRFDEQPAEVLTAGQAMENLPVMRNSPFPAAPINDMMSFQLPGYTSSTTRRTSRNRSESEMSAVIMFNSTVTNLPPILRRDNDETRIINNPDLDILVKQMNDENEDPIAFIVNKNLVVRVKVIDLDCCVEKKCWCFVSDGMGASNQEEVVILIKCKSYNIEELTLLRKVLQQMNAIFEKAKHGNAVSDSEQMEFNPNITCMAKNTGMLFYKPTVQCLKKLFLPTSPYLFGMYIERSEIPWAKNFPLRLLLRIGAEYKYYPCPLFNVLNRPALYEGVGRTILDLLADFRNFQYTLPRIVGVTINLRGKDTIIKLPRHRFDEVLKAVNASEENVLSLAGNFSPTCDGHLVSVEKDGRYKTQTLSIVLKENRKVTCASFFVMSAALKPDPNGIKAKASIVEDGVMVQVTSDVIQEFKTAIKEMKEYSITAGNPAAEGSSQVGIEWCSADSADRPKLTSPIDAKPFDNLTNMKIRHSYDYTSNNLTAKIHWVEVYFLPQDNDTTVQRLSARELGQMTSSIAKACMSALSPHLMTLIALEMTRIGLRVNLAANFVEYKIGANLTTLPPELLPTLDDKLVPAVHNVMSSAQERVAVELIFQLVKIV